jgi:hypothetical protein
MASTKVLAGGGCWIPRRGSGTYQGQQPRRVVRAPNAVAVAGPPRPPTHRCHDVPGVREGVGDVVLPIRGVLATSVRAARLPACPVDSTGAEALRVRRDPGPEGGVRTGQPLEGPVALLRDLEALVDEVRTCLGRSADVATHRRGGARPLRAPPAPVPPRCRGRGPTREAVRAPLGPRVRASFHLQAGRGRRALSGRRPALPLAAR